MRKIVRLWGISNFLQVILYPIGKHSGCEKKLLCKCNETYLKHFVCYSRCNFCHCCQNFVVYKWIINRFITIYICWINTVDVYVYLLLIFRSIKAHVSIYIYLNDGISICSTYKVKLFIYPIHSFMNAHH